MPPSLTTPDATYAAFESDETFTAVARRFGVAKETLRRWWVGKFGANAYLKRVHKPKQTIEQKKERRRAYREANKERLNLQKKHWRANNLEKARKTRKRHREANRQTYLEYGRRYYADNAECFREAARRYRKLNKSEVRAKEKHYYTTHPEILLLKGAKQRARKEGLSFTITAEYLRGVIPSDGRCPITQLEFKRGEGKVGPQSMTLDRIEPSKGYVPGNVAIISHLANTIKQDCVDPQVFLRLAEYLTRI